MSLGPGSTPPRTPLDAALDEAVAAARARYVAAHPESRRWSERADAVLPGGNTRTVLDYAPYPFRVERAVGCELYDVDGNRYVDLLGNYTAGLLGHSPAAVRTAAHEAIDAGWSLGSTHPNEVRLAELLVERFPSLERVRFTNSGTEANLMALATATHHTGRTGVVVFEGGYHGGVLTFGTLASGRPVAPVTVPHDWIVLPYNDPDAVAGAFAARGSSIAAVLVEPMQGSAGCLPGDPGWLAQLRDTCDRHGALLVFDEVMTSRLAPGGAQQLHGLLPDLTTLGKYLGGGFSFGAFGGRADVMAHFDRGGPLGHAGTFNNNVVTMAAGVAALTDTLGADALAAVNRRGDRLRSGLAETFARHALPMSVTGVGSLMNVHGTPGPVAQVGDLAGADDRWRELLFLTLLERGWYIARRGFVALSLEITDDHVTGVLADVDAWAAATRRDLGVLLDG